jgi:hypothetical protein
VRDGRDDYDCAADIDWLPRFGIFLYIFLEKPMNYRTLACFFVVLLGVCQRAPPIDFFKEEVTIEVLGARVRVTGVYYFENLTQIGKRIKFYYPFPVDSNHHFPDTISFGYPFERDSAGIYFSLSIRSNSIDSFRITYEQPVEKPFFRYITTTTKVWKRPIKEAKFTVVAPDTLSLSMNYVFAECRNAYGKLLYLIEIKDLFPEEDLIIRWQRGTH